MVPGRPGAPSLLSPSGWKETQDLLLQFQLLVVSDGFVPYRYWPNKHGVMLGENRFALGGHRAARTCDENTEAGRDASPPQPGSPLLNNVLAR